MKVLVLIFACVTVVELLIVLGVELYEMNKNKKKDDRESEI